MIRCILYKNIAISANPVWQNIVIIKSSDIEGQKKLLNDGFLGFNVSKEVNEFFIHYGQELGERYKNTIAPCANILEQ